MNIVTREQWGAKNPRSRSAMSKTRRDRIFVHWLGKTINGSDIKRLQHAQRAHLNKGWSDIGYSFAVGRDGTVYELRGLNVAGGHTLGENFDSYGVVCLIQEGEIASSEMLAALPEVFEYIRVNDPLMGSIDDVTVMGHKHSDKAATQCPGSQLASWAWAYDHSNYKRIVKPDPVPTPEVTPEIPGQEQLPIEQEVKSLLLRKGSTGLAVVQLQSLLVHMFRKSITVDGAFGVKTEQALKEVQASIGLVDDGVYGAQTRSRIVIHLEALNSLVIP